MSSSFKSSSYTHINDRCFLTSLRQLIEREMARCRADHESMTTDKYISMLYVSNKIKAFLEEHSLVPSVEAYFTLSGEEEPVISSLDESVERFIDNIVKLQRVKWGYFLNREVDDLMAARENAKEIRRIRDRNKSLARRAAIDDIASMVVVMLKRQRQEEEAQKEEDAFLAQDDDETILAHWVPTKKPRLLATICDDDEEEDDDDDEDEKKHHGSQFEVSDLDGKEEENDDDDDDDDDDEDDVIFVSDKKGKQFRSRCVETNSRDNTTTTTTTTFTIGKAKVREELAKDDVPDAPKKKKGFVPSDELPTPPPSPALNAKKSKKQQ